MHAVRRLCDQRGALLIINEIQTSFCRTGKIFACMHYDLQPDIICVAKAIAGGLPMEAVRCSQKITAPLGRHGSTFGGNPLCCAATLTATTYMLEQKLDAQAVEKGEYLLDALRRRELSRVRQVRGLGLMVGLELKEKVTPLIPELLERGLIALPADATVLRLLPPLVIGHADQDVVVETVADVLG